MTNKSFIFLFLLAAVLLGLAACGVKPKDVEPPAGSDPDQQFPRVYPDPSTDPKS